MSTAKGTYYNFHLGCCDQAEIYIKELEKENEQLKTINDGLTQHKIELLECLKEFKNWYDGDFKKQDCLEQYSFEIDFMINLRSLIQKYEVK